MGAPPLRIDWPLARLQQALPGVTVEVQAQLESTNTTLLQRLQAGQAATQLLVAEDQTKGRGRNGRHWVSEPGASLTFSVARQLALRDWSGLSLAVGSVLADAIEPLLPAAQPRLQVKWPNDLWLADGADGPWRKLGGILIETVGVPGGRACVVGIGLNVTPRPGTGALASGYGSVRELHAAIDAPSLLLRVAPPLLQALECFQRDGLAAFAAAFAARDLLRGRAVVAGATEGVAAGIDAQGRLLLRLPDQTLHAVASGEVGVRPRRVEA